MPTGVAYQVGSTLIPDGAHLAALGHGGLHEVNAAPRLNADGTLQAGSPAIDSADSAAAGETDTDLLGTARRDDTGVCDTGTGARTFDDRGAFEFQGASSPAVPCPSPVTAVPTPTPPTVSSIDFPASTRIADGVFSLAQRAGSPATPWHYEHTAYLDAVTRGLGSPLPPAEARDTPWDPELRHHIATHALRVEEEHVIEMLLADLACSSL